MDKENLVIIGARQNNLKNINLQIPHNKVTVVTGVSGSGKSSLVFDTLFSEGQWRYIESLASYARLFLEKRDRPQVDSIQNIRPAIAIEQKNPVRTARSTVGTVTEIYDYLRLLYAKIGRIICPDCGKEIKSFHPAGVVEQLLKELRDERVLILFPLPFRGIRAGREAIEGLLKRGFRRIRLREGVYELEPGMKLNLKGISEIPVVIDRLAVRPERRKRLSESLEMAFREGKGLAYVEVREPTGQSKPKLLKFSQGFRCSGCRVEREPPRPLLFSFNHPLGACEQCKGFGNILHYDEDLIIPDKGLSLAQGAIEPWTKPAYRWWQNQLLSAAKDQGIDIKKPYARLTSKEKRLIFKGGEGFEGIDDFFTYLEGKRYKLHIRVFLSRYRSPFPCPECRGSRLKAQALQVLVGGLNIHQLGELTLEELACWFRQVSLSDFEREVAREILRQIELKLDYLLRLGLGYLTLNRQTRTLSGGEAQRINLGNQLGSQLTGTLYLLDEPTVGLHPRECGSLARIVKEMARADNTVVVVEHDRSLIEEADYLIELGPGGGVKGGEVVFAGNKEDLLEEPHSLTARYLTHQEIIHLPFHRRRGNGNYLRLTGARENNLKNIEVRIPLHTFTCITGISGAGKSTLLVDTLYRALARVYRVEFKRMGKFDKLFGVEYLKGIRMIDKEPIGTTPRSNPLTYLRAFDEVRRIFAELPGAKRQGFTPAHFSFNLSAGRCPACQGTGYQRLEMYLFEDLYLTCDECQGRRFRPEILRITYQGKSIHQVLELTVTEAREFFFRFPVLCRRLDLLENIGLGYLRLGQPATTLSGGEAQRLKICKELGSHSTRDYLYLLDEPTTGLHFDDIKKLLSVLNRLVNAGNTVVVVEHNLEVVKTADYIIDLGPEGGDKGGEIVAQGSPEEIAEEERSYTGRYLQEYLAVSGDLRNSTAFQTV